MKKQIILFSVVMSNIAFQAKAQLSQGGLPLSMRQELSLQNVPVENYQNPDWDSFLVTEKRQQNMGTPSTGAVRAGLLASTDFGFPNSGEIVVAENGTKVWRSIISIDDAPAIVLYFDKFKLPKGVKLFLTNENKRQVIGAFDQNNNDDSEMFAIDAIQGSKVFLELNIEPNVNLNDIKLHINNALVMHRGIEHLRTFITGDLQLVDAYDAQLNGNSSVCMINAICATEASAVNPRKATIQTILPPGYLCSGTLVNSTANVAGGTCKPYFTTASHCEITGDTNPASTKFSQLLVRFNFERPDCGGTGTTNGTTMTGVNLRARSAMQSSWENNVTNIKGDFILYELKDQIPTSLGAVLLGWKSTDTDVATTAVAGKSIIGFHHPVGDNKKVTKAQSITSLRWPGDQADSLGQRWLHRPTVGYVSGGSSGSGLFDSDGYLIGIASVAADAGSIPANCQVAANGGALQGAPLNYIYYQKLSNAWNYNENGVAGANSLKPFLDPGNTGKTKINAVTANTCAAITTGGATDGGVSVNDLNADLSENISLFPNPSNNGMVNIVYNFKIAMDLDITVVDVTGKVLYTSQLNDAINGTCKIDLSHLSNGLYVVKINSANGYASKKLLLNK